MPQYGVSQQYDKYFVDTREPRAAADEGTVTLATTMKAMWPDARTLIPVAEWRAGKIFRLTAFGKITSDGTGANLVAEFAIGTGDAPAGATVGLSTAGTISRTDDTWMAQGFLECRVTGTSGVARMWGFWEPATSFLATNYLIPHTLPANVTVNTTLATNAFTFQLQRSGAGVWTAATTSVVLESMN